MSEFVSGRLFLFVGFCSFFFSAVQKKKRGFMLFFFLTEKKLSLFLYYCGSKSQKNDIEFKKKYISSKIQQHIWLNHIT